MQRLLVSVRGPNEALAAGYLGSSLVRTVKEWCPERKVYPAVFPEKEFIISFDPLTDGSNLDEQIDCDGMLIDTFRKDIGKGLLDYYDLEWLEGFVTDLQAIGGKEAWVAGSIAEEDLPDLWSTAEDVICVRNAACEPRAGEGRFGEVTPARV